MNRVVVITGASGGIGAAAARLIAQQGDTVALVARRKDALDRVATDCGAAALALPADVTDRAQVRGVVQDTIKRLGRIDVWINNAGQGITREPTQLTDDDIDLMIRANVKSVLYGMQEVLPHFRERGAGHIINVSSMLGRMPLATFRSAYTASKHFLNALTAMTREEIQKSHPGIQVSLVSPGVVRTEFGNNALHGGPDSRSLPWSQSAEEVAAVVLEVIETRAPDLYTREGSQQRVVDYYASLGKDPGGGG